MVENRNRLLDHAQTRREVLAAGLGLSLGSTLGSIAPLATAAAATPLAPTPECADDHADTTQAQTEGPFFTPRSPERSSLIEPGISGARLVLSGLVLSTSCRPVARALLDFWHADADGAYDNAGYRLRGHQFTDAEGLYQLETIVPGAYAWRTRHIHVKVQAPGRPVLTTQLYFPGERRNAADTLFRPDLLIRISGADAAVGRFDFVLNIG